MLSSNKLLMSLILSSGLTLTACKQDGGGGSGRARGARSSMNKNQNKPKPDQPPQSENRIAPEETEIEYFLENTNPAVSELKEETNTNPDNEAEQKGVSRENTVVKTENEETDSDLIEVEKAQDRIALPEPSAAVVAAEKAAAAASGRADEKACAELDKHLKGLNWTRKEIEVLETPGRNDSKKIKVSYFVPNKKELNNPVLLIQDYFRPISKESLDYFNKITKAYDISLVVMDPRGAGCSSAMPSKEEFRRWQAYGSRGLAQDAEMIRRSLLKGEKWKVLAHGNGGFVALRLVELYPQGIKSVHTADFTPMNSYTEYMAYRLEAQKNAWESFVTYLSKEKKVTITEEDIKKAHQTLDKAECSEDQKICGTALFDILSYAIKSSVVETWKEAAEVLLGLIQGEPDKENVLKRRALSLQNRYILAVATRMIDMDEDLEQMACSEALKDEELKKSPISSCRVEAALGREEIDELKETLKYEPLDHERIMRNFKQNKIDYYYAVADQSLFNPIKAAKDHIEQYKEVFKNEDYITIRKTSEAKFRSEVLKTLK